MSKSKKKKTVTKSAPKTTSTSAKNRKPRKTFKQAFYEKREKIWAKKRARVRLHRSFRLSYREDYQRELQAPGLVQHAMTTLKIIFKNWKLFLPLLAMVVVLNTAFVGLMSEETYQTFQDSLKNSYSALNQGELGRVAEAGLLLISYYLRHLLAGNNPKFRDGIYNALTPLISSLLIMALIFVHLIPVFIFIVTYSAAVQTGFLETPLYAFIYWLFSALLILLSAYLLPVSVTALVAVTVPGIYPVSFP